MATPYDRVYGIAEQIIAQRQRMGPAPAPPRTHYNPMYEWGSRALDAMRQLPAGLAEATVADTGLASDPVPSWFENPMQRAVGAVVGNPQYRPAIVNAPGALYGVIRSLPMLIRGARANTPEDQMAVAQEFQAQQGSYAGTQLERLQASQRNANELTGAHDPHNAAEMALRTAGGILVPATAPMKATAVNPILRNLQRAGIAAAELALPLRQSSLVPAALVTGAAGTVLGELTNTEHDNYTGLGEMTQEGGEFAFIDQAQAQPAQADAGDEFSFLNSAPTMGTADEFSFVDEVSDPVVTNTPEQQDGQDGSWFNWRTAVGVIGAALGGTIAIRQVARGYARNAPSILSDTAQAEAAALAPLRGIEARRSRTVGVFRQQVRNAARNLVQHDQPIRDFSNDYMGVGYARRLGWSLDRLTNTSLGSRMHDFAITGRYSGARYTRMAPELQAYGSELSPEQQMIVDNAILASRGLDDREAFNHVDTGAAFKDKTDDELRQYVQLARSSPALARYVDFAHQVGRDQLRFMVRHGLMTQETATEWARLRPHWSPFNRSVLHDAEMNDLIEQQFTANRNAVSMQSSKDIGGSVQAGAVQNPIVGLVDRWSNLVRMVEMNDVRRQFLQDATNLGRNPATGEAWVTRIPSRAQTRDAVNTHITFENGKRVAYYVSDPTLSRALHMMPRATWDLMETTRRVLQTATTGPLGTLVNAFAIAKAPFYDATLGMLLRKPGMRLGVLNEALLAASRGNVSIGNLDPTVWIAGYTGAIRYGLWDGMKKEMATMLSTQLLQQNSLMRDVLGPQRLSNMADWFTEAYENSTRSLMDQLGISSHTMHGSPDPRKTITNLQDIAPSFATQAQRQIWEDTLAGNHTAYEKALAGGRSIYASVRSNRIARAYAGLIEASHNGFRYQALATARRQKGFNRRMEQMASELRRLSGDASQYGGSKFVNELTGSIMYSNLSLQVLAETGRMAARHKGTMAMNIAVMVPQLMALHYLALATDEDAQEAHRVKTPEQRAASVTTFGGAEIPIDPLVRFITAPMLTLMDEMTGMNAGPGNLNVDLLRTMDHSLDGHESEDQWHELERQFWANLYANNPIDPFGNPLYAAAAASMGINPQMTRQSGVATPAREQQISGLQPGGALTDDMTSAYWQNFINTATGAFGSTLLQMGTSVYRSLNRRTAPGEEAGVSEALDRGFERWHDSLERGASPARPLFGDYPHLQAVVDNNWQQLNERTLGVEAAVRVLNQDVRTPDITGMSYPMALDLQRIPPNLAGTQLAVVGEHAWALEHGAYRQLRTELQALGTEAENIRNEPNLPRRDMNMLLNANTQQRRAKALEILMLVRDNENSVRRAIGREDFSYDGFNPSEYMVPVAPQMTAPPQ